MNVNGNQYVNAMFSFGRLRFHQSHSQVGSNTILGGIIGLPLEILIEVFKELPWRDILRVRQVNRNPSPRSLLTTLRRPVDTCAL